MQTSKNGILLPPGAQVRQFNSSIASGQPAPSVTPKGSQQVPPHLRNMIPGAKASVKSENVATQAPKINTDSTQTPQVKMETSQAPKVKVESSQAQQVKAESTQAPQTKPDTVVTNSATDQIVWSGKCLMGILGKAVQSRHVVVDLRKRDSDAEYPFGLVTFTMTSVSADADGKRPKCTHNLENLAICSQRLNQCAFNFGPSGHTYSLQFDNANTAEAFIGLATKLQQVMRYLVNSNVTIDGTIDKDTNAPTDKTVVTAEKKPVTSVDKTVAPANKSVTPADEKPAVSTDKKPAVPGKPKDLDDAFGKLSLDNVKGSSMYKSQRPLAPSSPRIQYTPQELFERRSSAEAPAGIQDVKIPLQKDHSFVRLPPHMQHHRQKTVTAKETTSKTENMIRQTTVVKTTETVSKTEVEPDMAKLKVPSAPSTTSTDSAVEFHMAEHPAATSVALDAPAASDVPVVPEALVVPEAPVVPDALAVPKAPAVSEAPAVPKAAVAEAPAVVSPADPVAPVATHAVSVAEEGAQPPPVFADPAFGNQGPSPETPMAIPLQMAPSDPNAQAPFQMPMPYAIPQQVIQAMHAQHLPNGSVLHAVSITYHISQPAPPEQELTPAAPPSRPFSPDAQVFRPQQNGATQSGPRPRRGLESSIFATGFSAAKFAGSFTGEEASR